MVLLANGVKTLKLVIPNFVDVSSLNWIIIV